jgi:hypothetical protein
MGNHPKRIAPEENRPIFSTIAKSNSPLDPYSLAKGCMDNFVNHQEISLKECRLNDETYIHYSHHVLECIDRTANNKDMTFDEKKYVIGSYKDESAKVENINNNSQKTKRLIIVCGVIVVLVVVAAINLKNFIKQDQKNSNDS